MTPVSFVTGTKKNRRQETFYTVNANTMRKTVFEHLRQRLEQRAGLSPLSTPPRYRLQDLERSEWDVLFERLMRNRLIMGALRYGPLRTPGKPQYDRVGSMERRLKLYRDGGNMELLVDVANLALCEFAECNHPTRHFSTIDGEERQGVQTVAPS